MQDETEFGNTKGVEGKCLQRCAEKKVYSAEIIMGEMICPGFASEQFWAWV